MNNIFRIKSPGIRLVLTLIILLSIISAGCSGSENADNDGPAMWGQARWGESAWNE